MDAEFLHSIAEYNRRLIDKLSKAVTPRGVVDAFCVSLLTELKALFCAGWIEGSDQFLICSPVEIAWIRMGRLPTRWREAALSSKPFITRPSIDLGRSTDEEAELNLEAVTLSFQGFAAVLIVPTHFVDLIKSCKGLVYAFHPCHETIARAPSHFAVEALAAPLAGPERHVRRLAPNLVPTLEDSLAIAERQIAEKSVLFIISEIFGSTLPLEVKMSSSIEIFKSFHEVSFVAAAMVIDGEKVIRVSGATRDEIPGEALWLDWFFSTYGSVAAKSREIELIFQEDWNPPVSGTQPYIVIPMRHGERNLGYFSLPWKTESPDMSEEDRDFFKAYAGIFTQGILVAESVSAVTRMRNFNQSILESMGSGVLTFDREGVITLANSSARSILGCDEFDLTGMRATDVPGFENAAAVVMATQSGNGEVVSYEVPFGIAARLDGVMGISTSILRESSGEAFGVCCIFRDLTKVKQMERRLIQNEKLVALGELAARVAHEIKNPLTTIRGFLELIQCDLERDTESYEYIDLVFKEVDYLVDSLDDLLSFTRETEAAEEYRFAETDLNQFVTDVVYFEKTCKHLKKIDIDRRLSTSLPACLIERGKLKRAISNVLLNSGQALSFAGVEKPLIRISTHAGEDWVSIRITDNGPGIPSAIRDKVLSPFFTTKSRGTGLGLAICERIMRKMGGSISFRSIAGRGTCFELRVQALGPDCSETCNGV